MVKLIETAGETLKMQAVLGPDNVPGAAINLSFEAATEAELKRCKCRKTEKGSS